MTMLIHVLFIGIWVGCVLTEALFERALLNQGHDKEIILAKLHEKVDIFIEIPAFIIVFISGAILASNASFNPILIAKITFGLLAIITNIYCVYLVFARKKAAILENWDLFYKIDHKQHKFGALVLLFQIIAIVLGSLNISIGIPGININFP